MDVIEHRINRINLLLDRLGKIPQELDAINEKLFAGGMDRTTFVRLVDKRNNLLVEQQNKEKELKEVYQIRL